MACQTGGETVLNKARTYKDAVKRVGERMMEAEQNKGATNQQDALEEAKDKDEWGYVIVEWGDRKLNPRLAARPTSGDS